LLDLAQDMWRYISDGMLKLCVVQGEVGSSTMPQKVNPIDFENAEGNLGLANALFEQYIRKLPVSRLQRDLSDSTVRRSFGEAFGHTLVAWRSLVKGLNRVEGDEASLKSTLETHWEVVAEGAQTILRSAGIPSAYQMLKSLTRGKKMTEESYRAWAEGLDADESVKSRLLALAPQNYLGLAEKMTEQVLSEEK
jgi:adenylosuccinate lyase